MAKYYCILFDADNTLLNFDAAENKALAETLVNYGIEPDAETVQTYRTINEELWRQLEKGQIRREKLFGERFSRFLKAINAAGDGVEMNRCYLEQLSTHPDLMSRRCWTCCASFPRWQRWPSSATVPRRCRPAVWRKAA